MIATNQELTLADLVRPLSRESLEYFANGNIPTAVEHDSTLSGKFIRIGEIMLIGTIINFGKPDFMGSLDYVKHLDMVEYLERYQRDLYEAAMDSYELEPVCGSILNDAGSTRIRLDESLQLVGLNLSGRSYDFGRADDAGRERTIAVAQMLIGDSVLVTGS